MIKSPNVVMSNQNCIDACNSCIIDCERCISSCLEDNDVKNRIVCIKSCNDCIDICRVCSQYMSRNSKFVNVLRFKFLDLFEEFDIPVGE